LATRLPLKVLDGVGEVDVAARDARVFECLVEHRTGWTDKRCALPIFLIAGLFPDEHDTRLVRTGTEDHLGRGLVEITAAAFMCRCGERAKADALRNKRRRRPFPARLASVGTAFFRHRQQPSILSAFRLTFRFGET